MKKRSLLFWLNKLFSRSERGLSLIELMVAISIVPTVIFASSNFQLYSSKIMNNTYDRGMRLSEQIVIFQYLERTMINGSSAITPVDYQGYQAYTACPNSSDFSWNNRLVINLPTSSGAGQPPVIYDFLKNCGDTAALLQVTYDMNGDSLITASEFTKISYFGSVDYPDETPGFTGSNNVPFVYDTDNKKVTVRLGFKSTDPNSPKITVPLEIKLSGGSGT